MKKPKYLYHGSSKKLEVLAPQKPEGKNDPKSCVAGIYATDDKKFALAISACRSSKTVHAFNNRNTHVQNIYKGWPNENATVYLYVLDPKDFKHNSGSEWITKKKIKPVKIEEYKVKDLKHLYRKSSKKELREWLKDRGGWRSPEEKVKKLRSLYKKYIEGNWVYRSQSEEHLKDILKNGFDPDKDPYKKIRPKLEKLYNLILNLEKKGHKMTLDWKGVYPSGSKAVEVSRRDLDNPFVDFTTSLKEGRRFVKQFQGGAIAGNVIEFIEGIRNFEIKLTKPQEKLMKELEIWAKKKIKFKNVLLRVSLTSSSLELAKMHTFEYKKYFTSPYGSFENFKKTIEKEGIEKLLPYLKGKDKAYVRVISKILASEIEVIE